jgi:hypothetical protein
MGGGAPGVWGEERQRRLVAPNVQTNVWGEERHLHSNRLMKFWIHSTNLLNVKCLSLRISIGNTANPHTLRRHTLPTDAVRG